MSHEHHNHNHDHHHESAKNIQTAFFLNLFFTVVEISRPFNIIISYSKVADFFIILNTFLENVKS